MRCDDCPLNNQPTVQGYGSKTPSLIVVGEAPGEQEVRQGQPFIGKSGQLLRQILRSNGYDDVEEVYWTNVLLCHPPDNRNPKAAEVRSCADRLISELKSRVELSRANNIEPSILAVGNFSSKTLADSTDNITSLRLHGVQKHPELGVRFACTFHPAYALRRADQLPSIVKDIERLSSPATVQWEPTKYKVVDKRDNYTAILGELANVEQLAVDIEVGDEDGHGTPRDFSWLAIGVSHRPGAAVVFVPEIIQTPEFQRGFSDVLMRTGCIYHNGKFDVQFLRSICSGRAPSIYHDSLLLSYVCDERKGVHDLESVVTNYLDAPMYKTETKKYLPKKDAPLALLPKDILYRYNAMDVDHTHRVIEPLTIKAKHDDVYSVYSELLIPAANVLVDMEWRGIHVDTEDLHGLEDEFIYALKVMEKKFDEWEVNPRSPKQVKEHLAKLGFRVPNTAADTLQEVDSEFAHSILEYRDKHKTLTTYLQGISKRIERGRIYPSYLLHGTESGRLSSRNPNIQNIPQKSSIRGLFTATPGRKLIEVDYAQIELRVAALLSGDPWLREQFETGHHIHKATAREMFGDSYTDAEYTVAKSINFGVLYGESPGHLAYRIGIPKKDAARWINQYYKRSPKLREYQKRVAKQVEEEGVLTSYFGRKRRFWLITNENWSHVQKEAYNFPIQSMASDITLTSLIQLSRMFGPSGSHDGLADPLITVHDSIIFEVDTDEIDDAIDIIRLNMEKTYEGIPMETDVKVGYRWGELEEL